MRSSLQGWHFHLDRQLESQQMFNNTLLGRKHVIKLRPIRLLKPRKSMEVILRKYGNSTVAVLPPAVLRDLGLSAGQTMTLDTTNNGQIVLAKKRKYILADLIAQCDPKAPPPADLALWDSAKPVGQEVW
jgi:antitoxin ChpS